MSTDENQPKGEKWGDGTLPPGMRVVDPAELSVLAASNDVVTNKPAGDVAW